MLPVGFDVFPVPPQSRIQSQHQDRTGPAQVTPGGAEIPPEGSDQTWSVSAHQEQWLVCVLRAEDDFVAKFPHDTLQK